SAKFNATFIRIGLSACDIGTSWLLPRLIGAARAQELMLTGRIFDAPEAERIGLATEVVPDDALWEAVEAKAAQVMLNTPFGVALTNEGMWSALEIPGMQAAIDLENRQHVMASATADHREAMTAFLERRAPSYTNASPSYSRAHRVREDRHAAGAHKEDEPVIKAFIAEFKEFINK